MVTHLVPASTRSSPWPRSSGPLWCARASTPRVRLGPQIGRSVPPRPSMTLPRNDTDFAHLPSCSTPWRCPYPPAWKRAAVTASRPSKASIASKPSFPASIPCSAFPMFRSGSTPRLPQALISVFLPECGGAGLDAAIVHASKILPLSKVDERAREVCLDLIYDRRRDGYDPLTELLNLFE